MTQEETSVIANTLIAKDYYELTFNWTKGGIPGQFLTLLPTGTSLLRRPFAFSNITKDTASIIYKVVGPGTKGFSNLKPGDSIDVLAPLGVGFNQPKNGDVLLAGGVGLGPMIFTANYYANLGISTNLIVGAREKAFIPEMKLHNLVTLHTCTDNGSMGFKGNVIEFLETKGSDLAKGDIFACGPHIMLKSAHNFSVKQNSRCYVSLEEMMACGVGACYGCVVETTFDEKYKRVCKDGPVFNSREIIWT